MERGQVDRSPRSKAGHDRPAKGQAVEDGDPHLNASTFRTSVLQPAFRAAGPEGTMHGQRHVSLAARRGPRKKAAVYEYKVVEIREKMVGGKMSGSKLEQLLNENARQGWRLKTITSADVKGRMGPGGVEGLLVTFERTVG